MGQGGLVDLQHVHGKTPLAHPPDQKTRPTPLVTTAASPLKAHPFGFQLNASCLSLKKHTHSLSLNSSSSWNVERTRRFGPGRWLKC